jgi:hypothetical protein
MSSLLFRSILLIVLLALSVTARADKTDVVYLQNGDRITGEAKTLYRGKLEFSTDHMGTLFIEWDDIREIISSTGQVVELTNGQRFYGPLNKPENSDMLMIDTEQGTVGVGTTDVIAMYPVEASFWQRLDVSASLGFAWDKGSSVGKYNLGIDVEYRDPRFITRANLSSEFTTVDQQEDNRRANLSATHMLFRKNKRFTAYFGNLEHNDELGIDLRALGGAGYGWVPIRSNRNWFSILGGVDVNHEIPVDGEPETNLEAVGMLTYEYYKYSNPERKFTVNLLVFPSITDFGRWRADFNTDFRLEFVEDLFWVLDFYANFDSDPISTTGSNSDYGITSSLAYKF